MTWKVNLKMNNNDSNGNSNNENDKNKNLPVVRKAIEFNVEYPKNDSLPPKDVTNIQKAVNTGGVAVGRSTYIEKESVRKLLGTDKKRVAMIFNNADDKDKCSLGDKSFLSTPEFKKQATKEKEEDRPQYDREKLDYAEKCVDAFSQNLTLQKERSIQSDIIQKERPKLTEKALKNKNATHSEFSGKPFDNTPEGKPVAHHINRVADSPNEALDLDNLVLMRTDEHKEFHNSDYLPNKEGYEKAKEEQKNKK